MFVHCSVIGRFILSPGIYTVPGATLNIHIFFFPFFVYFRGCICDKCPSLLELPRTMLHAMQLSLQLGTVRENRKRPIDCCNCSDSILKVNCQIFEACWHCGPGCFRVHHEAADCHICLQFLGSAFAQMSWTQSNDTLRFITYFQLTPKFVHSGVVCYCDPLT